MFFHVICTLNKVIIIIIIIIIVVVVVVIMHTNGKGSYMLCSSITLHKCMQIFTLSFQRFYSSFGVIKI